MEDQKQEVTSLKSSQASAKDNPLQVESLTRSQGLSAIENEIARIQAKYPHIRDKVASESANEAVSGSTASIA